MENVTVDLTTERALSKDSYDSIAFKGQSTQYLAQAIDDIRRLSKAGSIYPPSFATWRNPVLEYGLSLQPRNLHDGRLSPAEAVAIKVVADEGSAIAQNLFENYKKNRQIIDILEVPDGWPSDVIDGIASFGYNFCGATKIREKILKGESIPTGKTIGGVLDRRLWKRYQASLQLDEMVIGENTTTAVVKFANELVEKEIRGVPEGAKTEKELQDRMRSMLKGIELGAKIYKQILDIAVQRGLSTAL